jgi:hypothetical protein
MLYVDGASGNDATSCCGAQATPCRTITHALDLIWNANGRGVVVHAFNSDGSQAWGPSEVPHLGLGVTLEAPGILFVGGFQVYGYTPDDTDEVTIRGTAANPIHIGCFDYPNGGAACGTTAIDDGVNNRPALPLVVSGVSITERLIGPGSYNVGMTIGSGASVTLGPDPVRFELQSAHATGISCTSGALQDDPGAASPVVSFEGSIPPFYSLAPLPGLGNSYLDIQNCNVTLTQGPTFGNQNQFLPAGCDYRSSAAVVVSGSSTVTLGSAALPGTVQCAVVGIDEESGNGAGSPAVNLQHMTIDLAATGDPDSGWSAGGTCAGALVMAGSLAASGSSFVNSSMGVFFGGSAAMVDLSGGDGGGNVLGCNEALAQGCPSSTQLLVPPSGGDLVNATAARHINAQNTTWDHWSGSAGATQLWSCSNVKYSSCTCSGASCPSDGGAQALPPGADAVYLSNNVGVAFPIDSSQGAEAAATSCP